jgi:hypothetical protein
MNDPQDEFLPLWAAEPEIDGWPLWSGLPPPAYIAERDALRAELAELKAQDPVPVAVPAGFVLVPAKLTGEMIDAAGLGCSSGEMRAAWKDMLAAAPTAQPVQPSLSKRMAAAGYTPRDSRLTCDECGAKFTPQMAPLHECAQKHPVPVQATPVSAEDALTKAARNAELVLDAYPFDDSFWRLSVKPAAEQLRAALAAKGAA